MPCPLVGGRAALALAPLVALAFAACGSGVGPGLPCEEIGLEACEEIARFRCDGEAWTLLGDCHYSCVDAPPVTHTSVAGNETWTCEEGPHVVSGVLAVPAGGSLTVEAGAQIRIQRGARVDSTPTSRVILDGTSGAPVLVTSDDETQGGYGSITQGGLNLFATDPGAAPSEVRSAIVERGVHGVAVLGLSTARSAPVITESTFRDHEAWGILVRGCEAGASVPDYEADENRFFANGEGAVSSCQ